ncbi:M16 family metallopeptidase [Naasia lichenicola]|uniref:Insulinase family protein n=1 Tax=Naasia lichenicola TaxID=2565933 RepID=A0A4S4FPR5_9MICO|nr:pitrilysin family protein [Naasia lichenicola]THG32304.1 insulinase family protein [Naasia lichenicola]
MNGAVLFPLEQPDLRIAAAGGTAVRRTVLPSGLRILTEAVPGAQSATVGFWVPVGSRDETDGVFGSTHFLEHLLFKGTPSRTALDIAVAFDSVGGEHNAVTAKEYTCYYAKIRDVHLGMAVDVLSDMVAASLLDPDEFETERGVILEELASAEDDPGDVANERFFEAVLGDHPLGRPIGGSPTTIGDATRDAVTAHYRARYTPADLVVTAAGGVDHDVLVAQVERALSAAGWQLDVEAAPRARRPTTPASLASSSPIVAVKRPTEQTHLLIGAPALVSTDPRRTTMSVLNAAFGGGMSSRLFQEVRERRGLAYSVYSFAAGFSDAGVFGMYAACSPKVAGSVAELLVDQLGVLARDGITPDELRRAVGQLSGSSALALEDSDTRMSRLGRSELAQGEFVDLDEVVRRLDSVTLEDVRELAVELSERPLSVASVGKVDAAAFAPVLAVPSVPLPSFAAPAQRKSAPTRSAPEESAPVAAEPIATV